MDEPELKMATDHIDTLVAYLHQHPEITSVLITGGDPMIMNSTVLRRYIEPLLDPPLDHIDPIRIGANRPMPQDITSLQKYFTVPGAAPGAEDVP